MDNQKPEHYVLVDGPLVMTCMDGERRMAGVAGATPTMSLPHEHFARVSLLATPKARQITLWLYQLCKHFSTDDGMRRVMVCRRRR